MNVDGSDQINISGNLQKRMSVYTVSPFLLGGQTYVVFTARILTDAEYAAGKGNIHSSQPFDVFIGELEGNQLVNVTNLTATNEASETFVDVKQ